MARIRTIKPEFWKHEELSELPPETHMLAAALLNYADDEGYFNANPKLVKAECCPLREDSGNVPGMLHELSEIGYIVLKKGSDGKNYGHIVKFSEHQSISKKKASKIKDLFGVPEQSGNDPGTVHAGMEGNGTGNGTGNNCGSDDPPENRDLIWEEVLVVCGLEQGELSKSERGKCNKAVKHLKEVSASPEEVRRRSTRYREIFPKATLTPMALSNNWAQCASKPGAGPDFMLGVQ